MLEIERLKTALLERSGMGHRKNESRAAEVYPLNFQWVSRNKLDSSVSTLSYQMTKTYAQLAREIVALQASAQKQLAVEAKGAIAKINDLISKFSLAASDLKFASTSASAVPRSASKKTKATKRKGGTVSKGAKFSDGNGNQWGGRGPRPAWLRNAIAAGRTLNSFMVGMAPAVSTEPVAPVVASPAKRVAAKTIGSKRVKSAASSKVKPVKVSMAAKPSLSAAVAAPARAAKTTVKSTRVKGAPATKAGANKAAGASKPAKKANAAKSLPAESKTTLPVKKVAAKTAGPARKKAKPGSPPAARKAAVASHPASTTPEATAAAVAL